MRQHPVVGELLGWRSQQLNNVKDAHLFYTHFATHNVAFVLRQAVLGSNHGDMLLSPREQERKTDLPRFSVKRKKHFSRNL